MRGVAAQPLGGGQSAAQVANPIQDLFRPGMAQNLQRPVLSDKFDPIALLQPEPAYQLHRQPNGKGVSPSCNLHRVLNGK
jgi:hypothetical protein